MKKTLIFFDTEFHDLAAKPKLISIGLIDETGTRTFYAEMADTYELEDCSEWVQENVLPLLEGGEALMSRHQLKGRLRDWLEAFGEPVTLATDSLAWDWPRIQELFPAPKDWPANLEQHPILLNMNYLHDLEKFEQGVEEAFDSGMLRRHHALDDARANLIGWLVSGGTVDYKKVGRFTI